MPIYTHMLKCVHPNVLLIRKKEPTINHQGQNLSYAYPVVSVTKLHVCFGRDSLPHRKRKVKGRPEHQNQSINMRTGREASAQLKHPPEDKRQPAVGAKGTGRPSLTPTPVQMERGCGSWEMRKEIKCDHFPEGPPWELGNDIPGPRTITGSSLP